MSEFLHKLAEGLRTREKMMEDHAVVSAFDAPEAGEFKKQHAELVDELKSFREKVDKVQASGEDFDEHFEREIGDEKENLFVKIDTWQKSFKEKH